VLGEEIDSRKFLYRKDEESSFTMATFAVYLDLLQKSVSVNVLLLAGYCSYFTLTQDVSTVPGISLPPQ
jgi:hypothetical protein